MLDYEQSLAIAQGMAWRFDPQCCWSNAVQALRLYQKSLLQPLYVEGWCAMPEISFVEEHGWLELADGTILDPTYVLADHEEGKRKHYKYFPAMRYTLEELKGIRRRSLPRIWRTGGFGGFRNAAYVEAHSSAQQAIEDVGLQRGITVLNLL